MKNFLLSSLLILCTVSKALSAQMETIAIPPSSQLGNISTRCLVQTGDNVIIGGFILKGTEAKKVIVRAIGPSLAAVGVPNSLSNPTLTLHNGSGEVIGRNDDWQVTQPGGVITGDQVGEIQNSQLSPGQAAESAIIATLQPGNYTAIVRGVNNTTGVGLVEVYDLGSDATSTMGNISTRCLVQTGDDVLIGGFILQGTEAKKVIVRAIGPSLAAVGVPNSLSNPTLTLHNGSGEVIGRNDDWQVTQPGGVITGDQVSEIQNRQLSPGQAAESAIIATLQPGNYTAIVRGVNNTMGVGLVEVYDLGSDEGVSPAEITLAEVSEHTFNSTNSTIRFRISGETFGNAAEHVVVYHNLSPVATVLTHLGEFEIRVDPILVEGRNDIILVAFDSHGRLVYREFTLWAGDNNLQGSIVDENDLPVTGAELSLRLGDDQEVVSTAVSDDGAFIFTNLPGRTLLLEAAASQNRLASIAINGSEGFVHLKLDVLKPPSPIDNNDFSSGTAGWDIGTAPVQIVPHEEETASSENPWTNKLPGSRLPNVKTSAMDLVLNTQGEGPQRISRTFQTKPGTKNVAVRYRFITSEVPGGYFGTQYNDHFNVSIRSKSGGGVVTESQSMNGLGLGAFDANGATAWRETSLPVSAAGDTVQVNLTVANVADDQLDSQLVVDFVAEKEVSITRLALNDIDGTPLTHLSADANNPYFNGNTRIHGQVTVEGASADELQSLVLEIIQGGVVVAIAELAPSARGNLLKSFGPAEKVEISSTQLLFELSSGQAGNVAGSQDGTLSVRARATSKKGQEATKDSGEVQLLVRYTGGNRYGGRDPEVGGDDWLKPSLKEIASHFGGVTWGDASNMNGGPFAPHASHRVGVDIDGYFSNYEMRDAATAAQIIEHLNDATYGSQIALVFVTFEKTPSNSFWNAIKDVTLDDGRAARDVIRAVPGHTGHFHWRK